MSKKTKKRSRKQIRKRQEIILKAADNLQKQGIEVSHRSIVVGGSKPKLVALARKEREECQSKNNPQKD